VSRLEKPGGNTAVAAGLRGRLLQISGSGGERAPISGCGRSHSSVKPVEATEVDQDGDADVSVKRCELESKVSTASIDD